MNGTSRDVAETTRAEIDDLKQQVQRLTELVLSQQRQLTSQEEELLTLRNESHEDEESTRKSVVLSPLQSQIRGYGDRRYFGGFDARFHSIHK